MPFLNPCYFMHVKLLSYRTHFDKSTIEQVHIKFCKQTLNISWYTENIAWRAELGRYPLSIDIKASISRYWQRLKHSCNNVLLRKAFQYATTYTPFFNVPINEEITRGYQVTESTEPVTRQHIKSGPLKIKENLRNRYSRLKTVHQQLQGKNLCTRKLKRVINLKITWKRLQTQHTELAWQSLG